MKRLILGLMVLSSIVYAETIECLYVGFENKGIYNKSISKKSGITPLENFSLKLMSENIIFLTSKKKNILFAKQTSTGKYTIYHHPTEELKLIKIQEKNGFIHYAFNLDDYFANIVCD